MNESELFYPQTWKQSPKQFPRVPFCILEPKPPTPVPEVPEEELVKRLHVKGIDFKIDENTKKHR